MASSARGFTIVEILLVMAIVGVLSGVAVVALIRPQNQANIEATMRQLAADLKSQQLEAMAGDSLGASTAQDFGIFVESNKYTLFKGSTYSAGDTTNLVVNMESGITLSSTLPSNLVIFSKGSGDVSGFTNGSNTITVTGSSGSKVITINRYGAVTTN